MLTDTERENARRLRQLLDEGAFKLAGDPEVTYLAPTAPDDIPRLDFRPLQEASARLKRSARAYDNAFVRASASNFLLPSSEIAELNTLLQGVEQSLSSKTGLPGREWYQHMLYAPGLYTGYGAKTLPAVREAIELHRWSDATSYIPIVADTLDAAAKRLDEAATKLTPRLGPAAPVDAGNKPTPTPPPDS
jgi:N-acetylated-alpha-linked acidic dipeptidase